MRAIVTAPEGTNLIVVRIETSVPGLVGHGCAGFNQRALLVAAAVEQYLAPQLIGRDPAAITDVGAALHVSGYWRDGPVLNNAVGGVDSALWDIKGKLAGLPVWQLLGGRCRDRVPAYTHASGRDKHEVAERARALMADGYQHIRVQVAPPGAQAHGGATTAQASNRWDPVLYLRTIPELFEHLRTELGEEVELLHDVHERLDPPDALRLVRRLEPFRLFFLEDPLAPEDLDWLPRLSAASEIPIAVGELFTHPTEYVPIIRDRSAAYLRLHVSAVRGVTQAWRVASACELFGMRTAWHGPPDVSPLGHAANLALDTASPAFGIQEIVRFADATREVFPHTPVVEAGALIPSERPGLGVDFDERAAARFPAAPPLASYGWTQVRRPDGGVQRP